MSYLQHLLDNPTALGGGEEVVQFFQMPGYRSWDPSRVVFFSFVSVFLLSLCRMQVIHYCSLQSYCFIGNEWAKPKLGFELEQWAWLWL